MKTTQALILLLAAWLGSAGPAVAHQAPAEVTVTATARPASATLSRSGATDYAAYDVTIDNPSDGTIRHLQFTATTTVSPAGPVARFVSSSGASAACSATNADATAVRCDIALPLLPHTQRSFTLAFSTPTAGASINFVSKTISGEDDDHCREALLATATTTLQAPSPDSVSSYVPVAGATVFTGTGATASATAADPWTTSVVVPAGAATTASITEVVDPNSCSADLLVCNISTLTVPGTFHHLVIILRRDASTIRSSDDDDDGHGHGNEHGDGDRGHDSHPGPASRAPNIDNAVINYEHTPAAGFRPVANCSDDANLPLPGQPCIKSRKAYPKAPPTPAIDQGDWQFEIWAIDNGRYQG